MARKVQPEMTDEDAPELTDAELAELRPARDVMSREFFKKVDAIQKRKRGQRGPGKKPAKVLVTLRLDRDALDALKADGPDWRDRINTMVQRAARRKRSAA